MRFWMYATTSLMAGVGLVAYTYHTRQQFYPTVIYLVTSKVSVMVLCNVAFVLTILCGRVFKRIFLGTLRDAELEMLYDHARFAIAETCFTLSVFREEMTLKVLALFTLLLFIKTFHWLCQWRGEHIEQSEIVSRSTHVRLVMLMSLLAALDMSFVILSAVRVLERGPSVLVLFGFEFLVLFISLVAVFMRYVLHLIDARVDGTWANKFTYVFYLELITEIVKLIVYLIFFMIIFTYYGMPLHLLRDLWMSIRNLQRRIITYFRYRRITANMNERFPSPTEAELDETDRICIICREEMTPDTCKKLPCSHIFHLNCLRMWLQRQQTCPTCRANIPTERPPEVIPEVRQPAAPLNEPVVPPVDQAAVPPVIPPPRADADRRYQPTTPPQAAQPAPGDSSATPNTSARQIPSPTRPFGPIPVNIPAPSVPGVAIPPALHGIMDPAQLHYMQSMHYGLQLDPMYLQYQLDMLQAQLYVLRATSLALQSGALSSAGFAVPPNAAYGVPPVAPTAAPGSVPTTSAASPVAPTAAPVVVASNNPSPTPTQSSPATTPPSVSSPTPEASSPSPRDASIDEKTPSCGENDVPSIKESPKPQPAPMTEEELERERRREELRRIYSKRYGGSASDTDAKEDGDAQ